MSGEVKKVNWDSHLLKDAPGDDKTAWLQKCAQEYGLVYALVHADDGVIWGRFSAGAWAWSGEVFPWVSPHLRWERLLSMRLFGKTAEVFVWRENNGLNARLIADGAGDETEYFDERQLLWGRTTDAGAREEKDGFALMREGAQGLLHAPPDEIARVGEICARNYIGYDDQDCAFVKASRLIVCESEGGNAK